MEERSDPEGESQEQICNESNEENLLPLIDWSKLELTLTSR